MNSKGFFLIAPHNTAVGFTPSRGGRGVCTALVGRPVIHHSYTAVRTPGQSPPGGFSPSLPGVAPLSCRPIRGASKSRIRARSGAASRVRTVASTPHGALAARQNQGVERHPNGPAGKVPIGPECGGGTLTYWPLSDIVWPAESARHPAVNESQVPFTGELCRRLAPTRPPRPAPRFRHRPPALRW
jgi:hypothetical protein